MSRPLVYALATLLATCLVMAAVWGIGQVIDGIAAVLAAEIAGWGG